MVGTCTVTEGEYLIFSVIVSNRKVVLHLESVASTWCCSGIEPQTPKNAEKMTMYPC